MTEERDKIKVILCKPDERAEVVEIEDKLEAMQELVGGLIQEYMPWEDEVAVICNEEGKMTGLPLKSHHISTKALREVILYTIKNACRYAIEDREAFTEKVQKETEARKTNTAEEERKKYAENKRRYQELDILYKKLYESFARGIIAEEKFTMLSSSYEEEQKKLLADIQIYEKSLEEQQESRCDLDSFYELVDKYTSFEELTTKMLNEFVEKVLVHKAEKLDGRRTQKVEVYLNFIGCVEFPAPEKTAEELKREEIDKFWRDKYQRTREYELARRKKQIAKANEILDAQEEAEKERMTQEFSNEVKTVGLENMPVIPERLMNTGTQNNATSNY